MSTEEIAQINSLVFENSEPINLNLDRLAHAFLYSTAELEDYDRLDLLLKRFDKYNLIKDTILVPHNLSGIFDIYDQRERFEADMSLKYAVIGSIHKEILSIKESLTGHIDLQEFLAVPTQQNSFQDANSISTSDALKDALPQTISILGHAQTKEAEDFWASLSTSLYHQLSYIKKAELTGKQFLSWSFAEMGEHRLNARIRKSMYCFILDGKLTRTSFENNLYTAYGSENIAQGIQDMALSDPSGSGMSFASLVSCFPYTPFDPSEWEANKYIDVNVPMPGKIKYFNRVRIPKGLQASQPAIAKEVWDQPTLAQSKFELNMGNVMFQIEMTNEGIERFLENMEQVNKKEPPLKPGDITALASGLREQNRRNG
ncbi:hypothetical protein [Xanthocytophaga agilis]|uniref:Uncharacterized protein n=1 Tax=Xanthocytophaga agilis TaxID=3048010 RepID=A0AAE3R8V7_9BACT|nr:hypothetical protein [Xanthocytophaga agilis]MDJ1503590.1 hypothetical protein [Xanthocytophaga agilis]